MTMTNTNVEVKVEVNGVAVTGTLTEVKTLLDSLAAGQFVQQPVVEAKAAPKVHRIVESAKLTETTLGKAAKGSIVQLTATGAQYRVSAKGRDTVLLAHPKGEFQYPASRVCFAVR